MNKEMRRRICALISSYIVLIGCYLSSCHKNDVAYKNVAFIYYSSINHCSIKFGDQEYI